MRRALLVALLTLNFVALADPKGAAGRETKTQNRETRPADTSSSGSGYTVTTVIGGNPNPMPPNLAAAATSVAIPSPFSITVSTAGDVYFSSVGVESPETVFELSSGGTLTRVIGNGSQGYAGDGGLAVSAEVGEDVFLAVDTAGNLYVSDSDNYRIREVSARTGVITTVAGNGACADPGATGGCDSGDGRLAVDTQVSAGAIALDPAGNLYICGYGTVLEVSASTGIITTAAGNGKPGHSGDGGPATSAEVDPAVIALDAAGNLYFADGSSIRKVAAPTGVITTVVAWAGQVSPLGLAVDAAENLYISYAGDYVVQKVTASTGILATFAGGGNPSDGVGDGGPAPSARLEPGGIAVDASGNVYIADGNDRIRKVDTNGIITTVAGGGIYPGNGPATTAFLESADSEAGGITVDAAGDLYAIVDNAAVRDAVSTGVITRVAGNGSPGYSAGAGDGGPATSANINWPLDLAMDSAGNLYIVDTAFCVIRKVDSNGIITTVTQRLGGAYSCPHGAAVDAAGNLYTTVPAACVEFQAFGGYLVECDSGEVFKVDTSGAVTVVAGTGAPCASFSSLADCASGDGGLATKAQVNPWGIAVDAAGDLFIGDGSYRIRKVDATTGSITTVAGNGTEGYYGDGGLAIDAQIDGLGILVDGGGNLYIAGQGTIRRVDASTGIITSVAGSGTPGDSGDGGPALTAEIAPGWVAMDSPGNIYFTTTVSGVPGAVAIRRLAPPGVANLSTAATHAGNFVLGQNGTYTLAVSNAIGAGPTAGTVTVTDFVPQWVNLVSMSGDGWNCAANACTRSDALAGGASYPPISVTVSVPAGAPSQITNQVTVSTAGALPSGVSDFTLITPPPTVAAAVSGASFSGGVAPGSIGSIFGAWLGDAVTGAAAVPLPASLSGVSLSINGTPAPLWFVSPTQINFEMPVEVTPGTATAVVTFGDTSTAPFSVTVPQAAPGIFTYGANRAVAVNNPGQTLTDSSNPAPVGSVITVYLTGIGPVDQPVADNTLSPASPPARATLPASATIGGQGAAIQFIGLTPGSIALAQANIVVPNLAPGDYPVVITVGGAASNAATITVGP